MSEKKQNDESRKKFLEALEKKKRKGQGGLGVGPSTGSKIGEADGGAATKRFQRKSGSA